MRIYFDNAATTPLDKEVLEAMHPYMTEYFGNPSAVHACGRETRVAIEQARKSVAQHLGVKPANIFFTSGGTESNNTAITGAVRNLGCTHIITSPIEHHSVLHTVERVSKEHNGSISFVALRDGMICMKDLEDELSGWTKKWKKCLVTLMHANNETGVISPIQEIGELCKKYGAVFHSDCVQTVGHYTLDVNKMNVHFIAAAGHKFHGPKGSGILYVKEGISIQPFISGGGQERNIRAGTENVYGIVGFAKALDIAMRDIPQTADYIEGLKQYMRGKLKSVEGVCFNNDAGSLYTVLSVSFPKTAKTEMLLFNLDMDNICASGGSACSGGSGSHVMEALDKTGGVTVRLSFSKFNTKAEIDIVVDKIKEHI